MNKSFNVKLADKLCIAVAEWKLNKSGGHLKKKSLMFYETG